MCTTKVHRAMPQSMNFVVFLPACGNQKSRRLRGVDFVIHHVGDSLPCMHEQDQGFLHIVLIGPDSWLSMTQISHEQFLRQVIVAAGSDCSYRQSSVAAMFS